MRSTAVLLLSWVVASGAVASTLNVSLATRSIAVGPVAKMHVDRVIFSDENVTATVKLDVYAVPTLPSTKAHLEGLQKLRDETWFEGLRWEVRTADEVRPVEVKAVAVRARHMGPGSSEPAAKTVPFIAYAGQFVLPKLEAGTYTLHVSVGGLDATAGPFTVARGDEPQYRDAWLERQAEHATSYAEYRRLQLERVTRDPSKAAALLQLAARSLDEGTLEETTSYYDRAVTTMERNLAEYARVAPQWADEQKAQVRTEVEHIRSLQAMLPAYFAQRTTLRVSTDAETGRYRLVDRRSGRVVREE